jgi:hypothetical protein
MSDVEELLLLKGFFRLPGEKRAEILGMAKALAFAQSGKDQKLRNPITTTANVYGGNMRIETSYAG